MAKRKMSMEQTAIEQFLSKMNALPWDSNVAKEYGTMRATQESIGKPIANMDMLVSAHAAAVGAVLVTQDGDFQNVTTTVDWADEVGYFHRSW